MGALATSLSSFPRLPLLTTATPLERWDRLATRWGLTQLWVKRDDLTGLALGGSKVRKLEFELAEARRQGASVIVTTGGPQSNHARLTAAACVRVGLVCKLVLAGPPPEKETGNLLLNAWLGAEVRWTTEDDDALLEAAMETWALELVEQGERPYVIALGGSTARGTLGMAWAMHELAEQVAAEQVADDLQIVLGVGSCGSLAGVVLGASEFLPQATIHGVSVSRTRAAIEKRVDSLRERAAQLLGQVGDARGASYCVHEAFRGTYGVPTQSGREAMAEVARTEAVLLDPYYTGKVAAGVRALACSGDLDPQRPVLFWHTGGHPILFASTSGGGPQP